MSDELFEYTSDTVPDQGSDRMPEKYHIIDV